MIDFNTHSPAVGTEPPLASPLDPNNQPLASADHQSSATATTNWGAVAIARISETPIAGPTWAGSLSVQFPETLVASSDDSITKINDKVAKIRGMGAKDLLEEAEDF